MILIKEIVQPPQKKLCTKHEHSHDIQNVDEFVFLSDQILRNV